MPTELQLLKQSTELTQAERDYMVKKQIISPLDNYRVHRLYVQLDPLKDQATFGGHTYIRLSQVRLLLLGANVEKRAENPKSLSINLQRMGNEIVQDPLGIWFHFSHDSVTLGFGYRVDGVPNRAHAVTNSVQNRQGLSADHYIGFTLDKNTLASPGPFVTWKILVVCGGGVNPGLDLEGVGGTFGVPRLQSAVAYQLSCLYVHTRYMLDKQQ